jgi:predicted metal-dependent enzyme (double-stranded beta helix superfamily)
METEAALSQIARHLAELCADPVFVHETFDEDAPLGRRELHRDPTYDFRVLAHVQAPAKKGKPHDHGASWAVYGTAKGVTRMTDWRRVGDDPDHVVLAPVRVYDLGVGEAHYSGPHVLHSTEHPEKAWVIRVTGTDLDAIPRYHFRSKSDRMLEQA